MRFLIPIKIIIFTIVIGFVLAANAYAGDLEVTMDVVKQSDAENIMDSIAQKIELPKGDMKKVGKQHSHRSTNDTVEDTHHMHNSMNDAIDNCQMRDDMNDTMEDSHQMRDDMNDTMEDSYQMRDDMNGSMR
jgi:hypothetical protein